jgi:hypothetical protein
MIQRPELAQLAKPFPARLVHKKPGAGGGDYVSHAAVTEKLLATVGPVSTRVVELVRSRYTYKHGASGEHVTLDDCVTGVVFEMSATIDGQVHTVQEIGDVERPELWPTDGARAKQAASDGWKRAAMRFACGLHLWSGDGYVLHDALTREATAND